MDPIASIVLGFVNQIFTRMAVSSGAARGREEAEKRRQAERSQGRAMSQLGLLSYDPSHERQLLALPAYLNFQSRLQNPATGEPLAMYGVDIPLDAAALAAGHFAGELLSTSNFASESGPGFDSEGGTFDQG